MLLVSEPEEQDEPSVCFCFSVIFYERVVPFSWVYNTEVGQCSSTAQGSAAENEKLLSLSYFCERHKSLVCCSLYRLWFVCLFLSLLSPIHFCCIFLELTYLSYLCIVLTAAFYTFPQKLLLFLHSVPHWKLHAGGMTAVASCLCLRHSAQQRQHSNARLATFLLI